MDDVETMMVELFAEMGHVVAVERHGSGFKASFSHAGHQYIATGETAYDALAALTEMAPPIGP